MTAPAAVSGRVIDLYRRPVMGLAVHIDDKTATKTATTDAQGRFSVEGVAATYDVAFKFETLTSGEPTTFAWLFEGISRRDPTLQVYRSADFQRGEVTWHATGVTFPLPSDQNILAAFGCPDGDGFQRLTAMDTTTEVSWIGPPSRSNCVTHALLYRMSTDGALALEYLAHDDEPLVLSSAAPAQATLNFAGTKPQVGTISGRIIAPGEGTRTNWARVRWTDGAFLPIVEENPSAETFSYQVPILPDSNIMLVGLRGTPGERPLALAIADNLSPNTTGIELRVPAWSSLTAPADAKAGVDGNTLFQWSSDARVNVLVAVAKEGNDSMYVVTANKEAHLAMMPRVPYLPRAGSSFDWFVSTHGDFASMDEATGVEGFISGYSYAQVHGPRRGNGSFTSSVGRSFTTPP